MGFVQMAFAASQVLGIPIGLFLATRFDWHAPFLMIVAIAVPEIPRVTRLLAGFLFVLPAVLLSGVMSPIRAMPWWLEAVTWVNPVRHYAEVARGCLLRGAGFGDLAVQLIALAVLGGGVFALAVARFRTRLG